MAAARQRGKILIARRAAQAIRSFCAALVAARAQQARVLCRERPRQLRALELLERARIEFSTRAAQTLQALLQQLATESRAALGRVSAATRGMQRPELALGEVVKRWTLAHGRALRMAFDHVMCEPGTPIRAGGEVAFFPPVTGG